MFNLLTSEKKAYKTLSGNDFFEFYSTSERPLLIDVRTAGEFATGSIGHAQNIDITAPDFEKQIKLLDKERDYFVFCQSGNRSAHACTIMARHGLNVYNLKGGIATWPR